MANCQEQESQLWRCGSCSRIKAKTGAIKAVIQESPLDRVALNFVFGYDLGIAHKEFLNSLGIGIVNRHLELGPLFSEDRGLLDQWVTFHGKARIFVRGSLRAQYRKCTECDRYQYFGIGKHYLYPEPLEGVCIFYSGNGGIVVVEELLDHVAVNKWRDLKCEELPVLSSPLDGFDELTSP
jgi:hypothetical protein